MPAGVKFQDFVEVRIDLGGKVELFPHETGREQIFFGKQCLPNISLFEGVLDDSRVVPRVNDVPVFVFLSFALHDLLEYLQVFIMKVTNIIIYLSVSTS